MVPMSGSIGPQASEVESAQMATLVCLALLMQICYLTQLVVVYDIGLFFHEAHKICRYILALFP